MFWHTRVVFRVKSSPFLLASVIEYHIKTYEEYDTNLKQQLLRRFYVDNVVACVHTQKELERFIVGYLMAKCIFESREWEHTEETNNIKHIKKDYFTGIAVDF